MARILAVLLLVAAIAPQPVGAVAEMAPAPRAGAAPAGFQVEAGANPEVLTEAYLATFPADRRARAAAYFEGSHWIIAWRTLSLPA
jgi:hypothetical protein